MGKVGKRKWDIGKMERNEEMDEEKYRKWALDNHIEWKR